MKYVIIRNTRTCDSRLVSTATSPSALLNLQIEMRVTEQFLYLQKMQYFALVELRRYVKLPSEYVLRNALLFTGISCQI